jgi:hypothetical protein
LNFRATTVKNHIFPPRIHEPSKQDTIVSGHDHFDEDQVAADFHPVASKTYQRSQSHNNQKDVSQQLSKCLNFIYSIMAKSKIVPH